MATLSTYAPERGGCGNAKVVRHDRGGVLVLIGADAQTGCRRPAFPGFSPVATSGRARIQRLVPAAPGEGSMAIAFVHQYLQRAAA